MRGMARMRHPRRGLSGWTALRREPLDAATGGRFTHVEVALRIDAHPVRSQHLPHLPAAMAKLPGDLEIAAPPLG